MGELRSEFLQKQNFFYSKTVVSDCFVLFCFWTKWKNIWTIKKIELHK